MGSKKHKKHKSDRWGRYESTPGSDRPQLRLILKVGGSSTPEADHSDNSIGLHNRVNSMYGAEEESRQSSHYSFSESGEREKHKRKKEKKKKKNKDKDKDKEKKKHKHPKEKKRKEKDDSAPEAEDEPFKYEVVTIQPTNSTQSAAVSPRPILKISASPLDPANAMSGPRGLRTSLRPRQERPALQKLLELLLPSLERKDPRQFFAWPVTDSIAPGYSTIIKKPMDFSTMKLKIEDNQYKMLQEFMDDFSLMCTNAMEYNQPDTIYFKAAKRLLHTGLRILSPEKVRPLVPTISNYGELSISHLGFEPLEESFKVFQNRQSAEGGDHEMETGFSSGGETTVETARDTFIKNETPNNNQLDALPDDMTPDEILEQVQEASQLAASKLDSIHPNAKMGFLRQRKDGTTSLAILTPCDSGTVPGTTEVPVTLGALTGKIQQGTGQLAGFREDRRNLVKPIKSLYYGPYGSYAPSYDSTFANLTKEESDMVLTTYGHETGVPYAESILDFVRDCDYALHIADDLLNLMTHGEHTTVAKILEEKRRCYQLQMQQQQQLAQQQLIQQQLAQQQHSAMELEDDINLNSLRSLGDLGIDVSFLDNYEAQIKVEKSVREASQNCLDETGSLITSLERAQRQRLSKTPPPHLANIMPPSDLELQLVEKITEGITFVAKQSTPGSVVSVKGIRKAMGIAVHPATPAIPVTDHNDIESELSKLLGEDGEDTANTFH